MGLLREERQGAVISVGCGCAAVTRGQHFMTVHHTPWATRHGVSRYPSTVGGSVFFLC